MEVVHVDGPIHRSAVPHLLDVIHLNLDALGVLVPHPLVTLVRVRHLPRFVPLHRPTRVLLLQLRADLVVRQETGGVRVRSRLAAPRLLVDVRPRVVVLVAVAQRESASVERDPNYQFLGRATVVHPELQAVVDVQLLVGPLVVGPLVERAVGVGETGPVAPEVVGHHVDGVEEPEGSES